MDLATARSFGVRSAVMVPLRVKDRVFGVLDATSSEAGRLGATDLEVLTAVANHVALAVDRAQSFQTIEELSRPRGHRAGPHRAAAHRQRGPPGGVPRAAGHPGPADPAREDGLGRPARRRRRHELNNPIGFVYSNVGTLEDFVRRLRAILEIYRGAALPEPERARVEAEWQRLKVDYALKYLDSMTQGIKEGAERARKIVRDLRVFAHSQDDVWQPVDLAEEIDSSLTLLNHL